MCQFEAATMINWPTRKVQLCSTDTCSYVCRIRRDTPPLLHCWTCLPESHGLDPQSGPGRGSKQESTLYDAHIALDDISVVRTIPNWNYGETYRMAWTIPGFLQCCKITVSNFSKTVEKLYVVFRRSPKCGESSQEDPTANVALRSALVPYPEPKKTSTSANVPDSSFRWSPKKIR